MTKKALIILAEGAEEAETVITADVLVRGEVDVTIAGLVSDAVVKCSRNVLLKPHTTLESVQDNAFDCVVLPGGLGGAKSLASSELVASVLRKQFASGNERIIAAICAAPIALQSHQIANGHTVTSHPSVKDQLTLFTYSEERVCVSTAENNATIVTSRGPGTAFEFALKLVELLQGGEKAKALVPPMLLNL